MRDAAHVPTTTLGRGVLRRLDIGRGGPIAVGTQQEGHVARFINTRKAVSEIEDLIRNANDKLILVSPYLKLSKDFRQLLEYRNSKDKITTIIFGKQELKPDEMRFLQGLRFVVLHYNEDLHAKCYVNDQKMIITSLNLYEFSMANNREMGVLIDRADPADAQLFVDAMAEVDFIQQTSQRFEFTAQQIDPSRITVKDAAPAPASARPAAPPPPATKPPPRAEPHDRAKVAAKPTGFCIRTGVPIPFDLEKPMTYDAYKRWAQYGDREYPEKFCHFSGEKSDGETSYERPVLRKYWKKAKDVHSDK